MLDDAPAPSATNATAAPSWRLQLRQALLEVSVLDGVDLVPTPGGLGLVTPDGPRELSADRAALVLGDRTASDPDARPRLRSWLRSHAAVTADHVGRPALRPLALPRGSALHPGDGWVRERVLGGALDVGLGVIGVVHGETGAVPLWPDVLEAVGDAAQARGGARPDVDAAWAAARQHLDAMGQLAARRVERALRARLAAGEAPLLPDGPGPELTVLDPVGGCDVLTLLASAPLRTWLAQADGTGLRAVAVPTRSRGWTDLARIDSAFVAAAWAATDPDQRGLQRPALVTADEVVLAPRWAR